MYMIFLLLGYSFVMVLGLNQTSYILIFLVLEWLSWVFSITLTTLSMKYLLIQSYFSLVFLIIIFMAPELIIFSLLLKMGFPPFYNWAITLFKFFSKSSFLFVMTLHKVLPTVFSSKCFSVYFGLLSIVMLCALFLQATDLFLVLMFSSFLHGWWLILAGYSYQKLFWQYWMVYGSVLSLFLMSIAFSSLSLFSNGQTTLSGISFLVLSGFPPFLLFWMKVSVFIILMKSSVYLAFMLIFSSVVSLFVYFRVLCLSLSLSDKNNMKFIPVLTISLLVGFF
uniref:NADH dehydrogenase subunit 2 n=1 Tax=Xiphinema americanum TaxID=208518 RepID=Q6TY95_XIPAM|nr:NADH dehydrogenase subunit 2 [Xiphinema americanum]AAQ75777.1 NADH dehydrogenase subunit 2 [Xiphinema americanum]